MDKYTICDTNNPVNAAKAHPTVLGEVATSFQMMVPIMCSIDSDMPSLV